MAVLTHTVFRFPSHWSAGDVVEFCSIPEPNTGCWLWTEGVNRGGYGRMYWKGKRYLAHRVSWEAFNSQKIPDGMVVCHKCDVPSCVNPGHLWIGTQTENRADTVRKGRHHRGENHPRALLTKKDVQEILATTGGTLEEIGRRYGVAGTTIWSIRHGRSWKELKA